MKEFFHNEEKNINSCRKCKKHVYSKENFITVSNVVEAKKDKTLIEQIDEVLDAAYNKKVHDIIDKKTPTFFKVKS